MTEQSARRWTLDWLWLSIALLAFLTIGMVSAALNARFGYLLGEDEISRWGFMVLSIAVDVVKWMLPIAAAIAWRQAAYLRVLACVLLWLWAGFYSLTAAVGFSAYNRDLMTAGRSETVAERSRAEAAWKTAQATLTALQASTRWTSSQACTNATAPATKAFCAEVASAKRALDSADQRLTGSRAVASADPQAEFWARQLDVPLGRVQLGLTMLIAVTAEIMTMLGFFAVSAVPTRPMAPTAMTATSSEKATRTPAERVLPVETSIVAASAGNAAVATPEPAAGQVMKRPPSRLPSKPPPSS